MQIKRPDFRSLEEMIVRTAASVRPPERMTVSEAAAKYRYLNNPGSYVGKWKHDKTPYLIEFMDELTSQHYTGAIFVGPARTGKSDVFLNWLLHSTVCDPADIMRIDMTKEVAREWSMGDLSKFVRNQSGGDDEDSVDFSDYMLPGRQNDNRFDKSFKSGSRLLLRWPVISEVSGKTLPRTWTADYDRIANADDVEKEGPLFDLQRKRTTTYKRFGMSVAESSPGKEVTDAKWIPKTRHEAPPTTGILSLYNRGDRRRYYWRCPHCHEPFEPDFDLLNYPDSDDDMEAAEMVTMVCPHCRTDIEPSFKQELNVGGRWVKDGMFWMPDGSMQGKPLRTDIASFWLKGPCAAFQDWKSLVFSYLQALRAYESTGDESPLKKTITADQGKPYTPKALESARLPEELKNRALDWGSTQAEPTIPDWVRYLIATVDVQAGSKAAFVVQVHGVGIGNDVTIIDMFKIRKSKRLDEDGHPLIVSPDSYPEDWQLLIEQVMEKSYPLADGSGRRMMIKLTGCDSGGRAGVTTNAYNFWRWLRDSHPGGLHNRFQLVKGEPSKTAPPTRLGFPESDRKDRNSGARGDVPVFFINSTLMKDQIAGMLGRTEPGAGMIMYPTWSPDWLYTQLTAEVRTAKGWEQAGHRRNEAFDLVYYAAALIRHKTIGALRSEWWSNPPSWAQDWDMNDLVFEEGKALPFTAPKKKFDLAALADQLT